MTMTVAVRTLCDFTARSGDLDRRFTPAPTALQGISGHTTVTRRRGSHYETEVGLHLDHEGLSVRGRADGFDPHRGRIEEIKTHRGDLARMPDNQRALHWAQAGTYAHMLCVQRALPCIEVALVYFDIGTHAETILIQTREAGDLAAEFADRCARYMSWARQEHAHRQLRDTRLESAVFPLGTMRAGQRELAIAVYRGARDGRSVLAQAPTGIGKTLGTLFPALKACASQKLDKVYFLAAKGPGRAVAITGIRQIQANSRNTLQPIVLRTLDMVARDKACEYPGRACNGEACPLAQGFYDRLPGARAQALASGDIMDRQAVRHAALAHRVCPYYLTQELARWSDVIVGDYTYYFDNSAMLYALAQAHRWRVAVLVDEAHNLVERARGMYSATLSQRALDAARHAATGPIQKKLDALHRRWQTWNRLFCAAPEIECDPPEILCEALQQMVAAMTDMLDTTSGVDERLMRFYFDALHFLRLVETFGAHSLFDAQILTGADSRRLRTQIAIRNVIPATFLAHRHACAQTTCLFSGTLDPRQFYLDVLGMPTDTIEVDVASPFRTEQLSVHVVNNVSTRYRDRTASIDKLIAVMARQMATRPGNYLGFFSSFDYLEQVRARLAVVYPKIVVWAQTSGMDESARAVFLTRFEPGGTGLGFAVLGGSFGEGIDLVGDRLVGAFIATLGLPQMNPLNTRMMQRMEARFGRGYEYTYLYPGLQKVIQAAGRVIRCESDEGVVHLIDDRYASRTVQALLPRWWQPTRMRISGGKPSTGAQSQGRAVQKSLESR